MAESQIIIPEAARKTRTPELTEGITPCEYMGEDIDLPEFDPSRYYGLWCMKYSPHVAKMLAIMREFIPAEYQGDAQTIETELGDGGSMDPLAQRCTIGVKYVPVYHDEMGK